MTTNDFFKPFSIKDLIVSFGIHGLIILAGIIFSYRQSSHIQSDVKTSLKLTKKKSFINSAVRVDVVSMPKLTVKELKKMRIPRRSAVSQVTPALKLKVKARAKTKAPKVSATKSSSKNSFKSLMQNLSRKKIDLKNIKKKTARKNQKVESSKELSPEVKKQLAALNNLALEGNKLSKGNQLISDKISLKEQKVNLEQYAQRIIVAVKPNWRLPSYLLKKKINCQVRVYISENGDLINSEIYKSSGDKEFDERAINAVEKSAPFETPDPSINSRLVAGEILLGFPL